MSQLRELKVERTAGVAAFTFSCVLLNILGCDNQYVGAPKATPLRMLPNARFGHMVINEPGGSRQVEEKEGKILLNDFATFNIAPSQSREVSIDREIIFQSGSSPVSFKVQKSGRRSVCLLYEGVYYTGELRDDSARILWGES